MTNDQAGSSPVSKTFSLVLRALLGLAGLVVAFSFPNQLWAGPVIIILAFIAAKRSGRSGEAMLSALAAVMFFMVLSLGMSYIIDDAWLPLLLSVPPAIAFWLAFHRMATGNNILKPGK